MKFTEVRGKLGVFGWTSRILFWGWQLLMGTWIIAWVASVIPMFQGATSKAEEVGLSAGVMFALAILMFFWVCGSVILGMFVYFTRPARMLVAADGSPISVG